MTRWRLAILLIWLASAPVIAAPFEPRTGDSVVDGQLAELNALAGPARDALVDEVVAVFGAPRYLVRNLLEQRHWQPGDVYYACALAYRLRRPCADVARAHEQQTDEDWGATTRAAGIRPGTQAFAAIKAQLAKSAVRLQSLATTEASEAPEPANDEGK